MTEDSCFQAQKADTSLFPTITPEESSKEPLVVKDCLTRTELASKGLPSGPEIGEHDSVSIVSGSGPLDLKQSLGIVANIFQYSIDEPRTELLKEPTGKEKRNA